MNRNFAKYKKLLLNTFILGLGVFGSKLLVFLMMPIYTGILSPAEYSMADLISQTANLIMPLACVGIIDGVFRFAMDREGDKKAVLSSGAAVLFVVSTVFALISPLLCLVDYFSEYVWLIVAYVICANIHSMFAQYLRARDHTKLCAIQGVINTVLVIAFNILFLVVVKIGVLGYVLSVVVSDLLVSVFLFIKGKLYKDISWSSISPALVKDMLKYSVPMIPATIFWWITSVSDRYMVTYFAGETIQDNDRGVILGRRSFGKGLVQEPVNFTDGSGIRITVARFYTPSGRCIQKPYDKNYDYDIYERYAHGEMTSADSMKIDTSTVYYTLKGRHVYGGGGIIPDIFVPMDTTKATTFYVKCNRKATSVRFAQTMFDKYRSSLASIDDFNALNTYLDGLDLASQFLDYASRVDGIKPEKGEWEKSAEYMMPQIKALVGRFSKLGDEAFHRFYVPIDDVIQSALKNPSVID